MSSKNYARDDDSVRRLEIDGYITQGVTLPGIGSTINYRFQKPIGIAFESDAHGYAILHTAKPLLGGPYFEHKCRIEDITPGKNHGGLCAVRIKSTILDTYPL